MALTKSQIDAARDELTKDKRAWFCVECCRPRAKQYCPWNAKHPQQPPHKVLSRKYFNMDNQVVLFLSNPNGADMKHVFKDG